MTSPNEAVADLSPFTGSWSLDPSHTSIVFITKALWVLTVRGAFTAVEGSGTVGADGSVSGSIVIDASSVDTKKKKRDDHLRTADFFEVDAHPTITFSLTHAHPKGAGTVELTGTSDDPRHVTAGHPAGRGELHGRLGDRLVRVRHRSKRVGIEMGEDGRRTTESRGDQRTVHQKLMEPGHRRRSGPIRDLGFDLMDGRPYISECGAQVFF